MKRAIVVLSGGLDSTTCSYIAKKEGYRVCALTVDYGQRHKKEIDYARRTARRICDEHIIINLDLSVFGGSALTNSMLSLPQGREVEEMTADIPITYVPARNTILISLALAYAEVKNARAIYLGVNALDYSGYPDCRPEFIAAFQNVVNCATRKTVEGESIEIITPLIKLTKAQIIKLGKKLNVPFENTWSCYSGKSQPCGTCDSCILRAKGFKEASLRDPLIKRQYKMR